MLLTAQKKVRFQVILKILLKFDALLRFLQIDKLRKPRRVNLQQILVK